LDCDNNYTHITAPEGKRYENNMGQCILIFAFNIYLTSDCVFINYERQRQVINAVKWLSGKNLPAVGAGHPDLYLMTKKNEKICSYRFMEFQPGYNLLTGN